MVLQILHVPVFLNMETELGDIESGTTQLGPVTEKDFLNDGENQSGYKKTYDDKTHWIEIENEDYKLVAVYDGSNYHVEDNSHCYLIGIPIELGAIPNPGFPAYVINIKNEKNTSQNLLFYNSKGF